jgi:co-chaperonin GroES (HSP10)
MKILPLRNNIMFCFLDETSGSKGKFTERKLASGIVLPTLDSSQKLPRWGEVLAAGPESQVKPGEYILIESLMWTFGTEVDGQKMWKTDDQKIIMVTDDINETYNTSFPEIK